MKPTKVVEIVTGSIISLGAISVLLGGGTNLAGLTAAGMVKLGKISLPHCQIEKVLIYANAVTGAGLFLIGVGQSLDVTIGDYLLEQEFQRSLDEPDQQTAQSDPVPSTCLQCRYFSNNSLLPCAVHPNLKDPCTDWELKNSN